MSSCPEAPGPLGVASSGRGREKEAIGNGDGYKRAQASRTTISPQQAIASLTHSVPFSLRRSLQTHTPPQVPASHNEVDHHHSLRLPRGPRQRPQLRRPRRQQHPALRFQAAARCRRALPLLRAQVPQPLDPRVAQLQRQLPARGLCERVHRQARAGGPPAARRAGHRLVLRAPPRCRRQQGARGARAHRPLQRRRRDRQGRERGQVQVALRQCRQPLFVPRLRHRFRLQVRHLGRALRPEGDLGRGGWLCCCAFSRFLSRLPDLPVQVDGCENPVIPRGPVTRFDRSGSLLDSECSDERLIVVNLSFPDMCRRILLRCVILDF
ncbi:hypothetical protein B0J12DRAFT_385449 [Macrophomina phaseolina]|uniref:Uncharacterized protein n=1 Tax=Macrophomina phaseolina TaxID=35725 RepID=A0ABQ8FT87_9PEZI|nr:hypothetical protein B0J12DRAFT_385449 [Macrophomina phaseolina]